jgi:integrase
MNDAALRAGTRAEEQLNAYRVLTEKHGGDPGPLGHRVDFPPQEEARQTIGVFGALRRHVEVREERLAYYHRESTAFFPTFRLDSEFITQQSMGKLKDVVQNILGVKFQLKDARRAYGQRILDRGVPIEFVSHCLGHSSVATTQKFYADYRDKSVLSQVHGILNGRVQPSHN